MHAAAYRVELRLPDVRSLKAKRHRVSVVSRDLRKAFPAVGLAEVGFQDEWQRTTIGLAAVASDAGHLRRLQAGIIRHLDGRPDVELLDVGVSHLERA